MLQSNRGRNDRGKDKQDRPEKIRKKRQTRHKGVNRIKERKAGDGGEGILLT
jgi:hypothetical protein